jgi:hypothetical protein
MRLKSFARTLAFITVGSSVFAIYLAAQTTQEPSIADAARQNREQKKSTAKPGSVITNDTLSPVTATPARPGTPSSPATTSSSAPAVAAPDAAIPATASTDAAATNSAAQTTLSPEDKEKLKAEIDNIKQQLKESQGQVELLQRLYDLDKDALYSKPDPTRDTAGVEKLNSELDELKQKQEEFAKLKAELESIAPKELTEPAAPKP